MKPVRLGFLLLLACAATASAQQPSFSTFVGDAAVGDVKTTIPVQVPYIIWGGDVATFVANGGLKTTPDSIYGKAGSSYQLTPGDDFPAQVKDYLSGKSPYLSCTMHMLGVASELTNADPRTKPVVVLQMTWSAGDHIVARQEIKTLNDLKGKKIVLQQGGPHLGLLNDSLKAAALTWADVTPVWVTDLTGPKGPAEAMRKDPSIAAACVITPDMIGLCSGLEDKGSGADGTIKDAHVVNSTATMSRSIADVYAVRSDYYKAHRQEVDKFVVGYLKATEQLLAWKDAYNNGAGNSPEYVKALTLAQKIYGDEVLPTIEEDAHGLVSDASFARIPGNEVFFEDPNNLTGFEAKQTDALNMAADLGYVKNKFGFDKITWDYKQLSEQVGVKYVAPILAQGRIQSEGFDFTEDFGDNTILSFEIHFKTEATSFPVESYAAEFQRVAETSQTFGNALILVRGHADVTQTLADFYWSAQAKGLIKQVNGKTTFKDVPFDVNNTAQIMSFIQNENLSGQSRRNKAGQTVPIQDPRTTVAAALQLSQVRANNVLKGIKEYSDSKGYMLDFSSIKPVGVGIAEPIVTKPTSTAEAEKNQRVEIRVVRVSSEAVSEDAFNFDQ